MKTPHLDKLNALFVNPKLPDLDREKKQLVMERYHQWIGQLQDKSLSKEEYLQVLVNATNTYKNFIDIDFIFSSEDNFLYRQKGQLKLDNTVLEECLPYLVDRRLVPGLFEKSNIFVGDEACYAGLSFGAWLSSDPREMFFVKKKNQDFAVGKRIDLSIKDGSFEENLTLNIAYFAAELKTNLDKTMFQEASATARELKSSVQKSNYYLVTEWLDMTPIDSASTSIDSVIVLRKAKRLNSNLRSNFSTVDGRQSYLAQYRDYIESNPLALDMVTYIVDCLNTSIPQSSSSSTEDHLSRGYFLMFRVVDLFAGSGGFSLGFDLAGFKVDTHIELDRYASLTLKKNHPNSRVITDDVRFLNPHAVADHRNVDVLIGGPPCQGFSVAGSTQFGIEDDRNELVFWYLRFVEALKPKIAIVENVPNVLTKKSKGGVSVLDLVTEIAEEIGYMVSYQVMNAANYGVPQSRRRAFIVLHSPGTRFQFPPHTHEEVGERSLFADTKSYVTVGDALADLPLVDAGKVGSGLEYAKPAISEYQRYCRDNSNGIVNHDPMKHTERVIERFRVIQKGKSLKDVPLTHGQIAYGTGETVSKPFKYNNYRLDDQKCALAIPASFQSLFVHPFQDRNLTAREGARIMSFPDHYEFCGPKTMMSWESGLSQYNQIGNAVCPLVARALGYAVQDYLERAKNIEVFRSSKTLEKISQGLSKSRFTLGHAASAARNFRSHMPLSEDVISKSTYYQRSRKIFKIEGKEVPVDLVQIAFQLLNESSCLVCDAESAPFGDHTNGMNLLISKSDLQSLVDKGNDHGLDYHLRLLGSTDERLANEVATVLNDLDLVDIIKEANPRTGKQVKTMKLKTR